MNETIIVFETKEMAEVAGNKPTVSAQDLTVILTDLAKELETITVDDLSDDAQVATVKQTAQKLVKVRTSIVSQCKTQREGFIAGQKSVIAIEKSLVSILEGQEARLKGIVNEANTIKERAARINLLPMRREQLFNLGALISDEEILDFHNDAFIVFLNEATAAKNERDRLAIEAEKAQLAKDAELKAAATAAATAERTRIEASHKADEEARVEKAAQAKRDAELAAQKTIDDAKAEAERVLQAAKDKIAQEAAQAEAALLEKEAREQQARDDTAKKEAQVKYLAWAKEQGWTAETALSYTTKHTSAGIELWKIVGTYTE